MDIKIPKQSIKCVSFGTGMPLRLSEEQKPIFSDAARNSNAPVFAHIGEGVSDETRGYLFVKDKGEMRCIETTYGNAKNIVARAA